MKNGKEKSMFVREYLWRDLMTVCGLFVILLTIVIGAFPQLHEVIHIPGLQTFLPGILRICRLGTGGQYGRRRQHRCADLHRWVALHLRPGTSYRDSVFLDQRLHHGDLPVRRNSTAR